MEALSCVVHANHLYVHVPFCARRCVYCDFSIAVRSHVPVEEYIYALDREWLTRHRESEFDLATLYLGGGTPSKLGAEGVSRLMEVVRCRTKVRDNAEITLEANPEDVSPDSARAWRDAGINRVSLGVQSFNDQVLAWMHRTHDAKAARHAVEVLREEGIANLSIDLIFATPLAIMREWEHDLEIAMGLELPHLSVYGLTVEPQTPLGRWVARRDVSEATEETFETEYLLAHHQLTSAGFEHYEVSNYGKPGWHSRHNWAYWNRKAYGGLGPSAHEFDGAGRRWNASAYVDWVARVTRGEDPREGREELGQEQRMAEEVYLNLRTSTGTSISPAEYEHIARLLDAGWAALANDSTLRLTGAGWLRLDSIANNLTLLRSRS
ncbi:MAG TPA: radical SAM family heme chaperone HemW [Gemmatimonadaceae bacterium]